MRWLRVAGAPTSSMPTDLRTTLRPPSAPTSHAVRSGRLLVDVRTSTPVSSWATPVTSTPVPDRHPELLDPAAEDLLDVTLREAQRVGMARRAGRPRPVVCRRSSSPGRSCPRRGTGPRCRAGRRARWSGSGTRGPACRRGRRSHDARGRRRRPRPTPAHQPASGRSVRPRRSSRRRRHSCPCVSLMSLMAPSIMPAATRSTAVCPSVTARSPVDHPAGHAEGAADTNDHRHGHVPVTIVAGGNHPLLPSVQRTSGTSPRADARGHHHGSTESPQARRHRRHGGGDRTGPDGLWRWRQRRRLRRPRTAKAATTAEKPMVATTMATAAVRSSPDPTAASTSPPTSRRLRWTVGRPATSR